MKKPLLLTCIVLAIASVWAAIGLSQQTRPNAVKEFMRAKLDHSQKVLEGLAVEDFDMIAKNSQAMSLLSQASNWQVLETPEYLRQSKDFQHTAEAVRDAAKKKNLDGAALAYVELTMKCVNCHKYVRGMRMASP